MLPPGIDPGNDSNSQLSRLGLRLSNVVGAPLVKRYFPDRQAVMVTTFALLMQAGATLPAMTAIPVAVLLSAAGPLGYLLMIFDIGPPWLMTLVAGLAGGTMMARPDRYLEDKFA